MTNILIFPAQRKIRQGGAEGGANRCSKYLHLERAFFALRCSVGVAGLANGVSIENVAKMLGHSNIKMTQHYAKVLDSSILKDMMNVKSAMVN